MNEIIHNRVPVFFICILLTLFPSMSFGEKIYLVSPDGIGINSLAGAREDIRKNYDAMAEDIVVILKDGIYQLDSTMRFDTYDGGKNDFTVTYKAEEGASPIISGGHKIENWVHDEASHISSAELKGNCVVRNLWNGEIRTPRSRGIQTFAESIYRDDDNGICGLVFDRNDIPDFGSTDGLEISYKTYWRHYYFLVDSIVDKNSIRDIPEGKVLVAIKNFDLALDQSPKLIGTGNDNPYYFENALELMDENSGWCFQPLAGVLYSHNDFSDIIVADIETLIDIKSSVPSERVKNLSFEGIKFCYSTWNYPSQGGFIPQQSSYTVNTSNRELSRTMIPGAVQLEDAENIEFSACTFSHLGSNGISVNNNTEHIAIQNNVFEDISGTAIRMSDFRHAQYDENILPVSNTIVLNNLIKDIGVEFASCCGIEAFYVDNLTIANNELYEMPYSGISVGMGWTMEPNTTKNVKILRNKIIGNTLQCHDGAAIYTLSYFDGDGCLIEGNYIDEISNKPCNGDQGAIYTDQGSSNVRINNNVVLADRKWFFYNQPGRVLVDSTYVLPASHFNYGGNDAISGGTDVNFVDNGNRIFDLPNEMADKIVLESGIVSDSPSVVDEIVVDSDFSFTLSKNDDGLSVCAEEIPRNGLMVEIYCIDGSLKQRVVGKSAVHIDPLPRGLYILIITADASRKNHRIIF